MSKTLLVVIGLVLLVNFIRQRLFGSKPDKPHEEVDLLNNPISHASVEETHDSGEKTIPIYKLNNITEAETLKALLEDNGIDCLAYSFHDFAYDSLWQDEKGWGVLKVIAKDKSKAETLIDDFIKAKDQPNGLESDEMPQSTSIPIALTRPPKIFLAAAIMLLLAVGIFVAVKIYSAYRDYSWRCVKAGLSYSINNPDKAIEYYDKAINSGDDSGLVYLLRGLTKSNKGDYDGAINDFNKVIELAPDASVAYTYRGYAQYKKGDIDSAIKDYDKAIEIHPEFAYAWYRKGSTLLRLGRYEEALKVLDKSIELEPENADAWYSRAGTYSLKNDKPNALTDLNKSVSLNAKLKAEAKKDDAFKWLWEDEEFKKLTEE